MTVKTINSAQAAVELTIWLDKGNTLTNVFRVAYSQSGLLLMMFLYASNEIVQVSDNLYPNYQMAYGEMGRLIDFVRSERKKTKAA